MIPFVDLQAQYRSFKSEIDAAVKSPYLNGIFGSAFTALRVDISNVIDPIHVIGGDVEIRDSWLHDNDFLLA